MSFFLKNYDKLAAFVAFAGVALSVVCLVLSAQMRATEDAAFTAKLGSLRPAHPEAAPFDMLSYETAEQLRENPRRISLPAKGVPGFFTTDIRVWCPNCKKPIPEKLTECSACGADIVPPPVDPQYDIYGKDCPIKYGWAEKHGMDLTNMNAPNTLVPGKEWTWLEMFEYITKSDNPDRDPRDPNVNPPIESKLVLDNIKSIPIGLRLTAASIMPDKTVCTVNDSVRTFFVTPTTNDALRVSSGDKDLLEKHGYKAIHFEKRTERRETTTGVRDVDTSILTLLRVKDGTKIQLHMDQPDASEEVATLRFPLDNLTFNVIKGGAFTLRGTEFLVIEIDNKAQSVIIKNKATEKISTVKR